MGARKSCIVLLTLYVLVGFSLPLTHTDYSVTDFNLLRVNTLSGELPIISLVQPENASLVQEGAIIQVNVTSIDLHRVLYSWDNATTNSTWIQPYLTMVPGSIGNHTLNVYANNTDNEWSNAKFVFETFIYDPVDFSACWGGHSDDNCEDIAIAPDGSICAVGRTQSDNYPIQNAIDPTTDMFADAFITKLDPTGTYLNFSTYFGGDTGYESAQAVTIDGDGYIYVAGYTESTDFPTTTGAYMESVVGGYDTWVAKFTPNGSLVYCSLIGGSNDDYALGISVDSRGYCYVVGTTQSGDFPTHLATQSSYGGDSDVFISVFNPGGSALVFSTYLGGNSYDHGYNVAIGPGDVFYVTGNTHSTNFPVVNADSYGQGMADAFITKYDLDGAGILFSTRYGGTHFEESRVPVAIDSAGNCYITGSTESSDLPLVGAIDTSLDGYYDAFLAKFSPTGLLEFSSYLGGSEWDVGTDVAMDNEGKIYVSMSLSSEDAPLVNPFDETQSGTTDAYVAVVDTINAELMFSSYVGGLDLEEYPSIAVSPSQHIYVAGTTMSTDFPLTAGAYVHRTNPGSRENFLMKISPIVFDVNITLYDPDDDIQPGQSYEDSDAIIVDMNSDFPRLGFPGTGAYDNPYIIENLSITSSDGIHVSNVDAYFVIRNCLLKNTGGSAAIKFVNVTHGLIDSCFITTENNGIVFEDVRECTIQDVTIDEAGNPALYFIYSYNCTVIDCTIKEAPEGIFVYESELFELTRCSIGVTERTGVYLIRGHNWIITNCTFYENWEAGIRIGGATENCSIIGNVISHNHGYGLWMESGVNCISYDNAIGWNDGGNAYETHFGNQWDDGVSKGNRWSDYNQTPPYLIPGGFGSVDHYPEAIDDYPPVSDSPPDSPFEQGVLEQYLTWNTYDDFPMSYAITRNNTIIKSGPWRQWALSIEVAPQKLGAFEYTLTLFDEIGNSHQDFVMTTIVDTTAPTLDHPDDIVLLAGVDPLNITWVPFDLNPASYEIWANETLVISGPWNASSEALTVYEDLLLFGVYNYTAKATDRFGSSSYDTVFVTAENDFDAPSITGPATIEFMEGSDDNFLVWSFNDKYPDSYIVFLNGSIVLEGTWNAIENSITIQLDSLEVGTHNYTVLVTDRASNLNVAVAMVTVNPLPTPSTTPTTPTGTGESLVPMLAVAVGTAVTVGVIGLIAHAVRTNRELDWAQRMEG